ncbi:DUF1801 domain-containing protein [Leptospira barantonii]|uniref:DUF1801 domain-containing protein n=2 Tax=Leptospira barantonii TaxID=2023184 RepID=A0A5F2BDB8_9LEPT|nr:DUF1801 domain-containing protein [Leptospira barantonii]
MSSGISRYIDSQVEIKKERMLSIRAWIIECFPEILESMDQKIPTYHLNENWIAFGAHKNSISIHICKSVPLTEIRKKFPSLIDSKFRFTIRDEDPIPWKEIQSSIRSVLKSKTKSLNGKGRIPIKRNSPSKKSALRQNTRSFKN